MELNFTPKAINEIEVENKHRPFYEVLGDISLRNLALFVRKGMNLKTEEEAFDAMGKYFIEEGGDLLSLNMLIARRLQDGGFLPRKINLDEMETNLDDQIGKHLPE
jgi:hypothetical protein